MISIELIRPDFERIVSLDQELKEFGVGIGSSNCCLLCRTEDASITYNMKALLT